MSVHGARILLPEPRIVVKESNWINAVPGLRNIILNFHFSFFFIVLVPNLILLGVFFAR